jgi:hypothetical protein
VRTLVQNDGSLSIVAAPDELNMNKRSVSTDPT